MLLELLEEAHVIVCVGSGGVGKTTVSAALAMTAALEGQKVLVMTIDPARRLADALGISSLGDDEYEVPAALWEQAGLKPKGQLFGMMLNQKLTFDRLVERFAPTQESAATIKANRWYQQMSTALAGAQDYMAVEKLHEMAAGRDYDLIILDTPPTSNALDFLEAPERIKGILGIRSMQWIQDRLKGSSRTGRFLRWGGNTLLKALGRITGKDVIQEITQLLDDLSVLYDSFQVHADAAWALLRSPECRFVQVSVPRRLALTEALFLQGKLREANMHTEGFILNRVPGYAQRDGAWHPFDQNHQDNQSDDGNHSDEMSALAAALADTKAAQDVDTNSEDIAALLASLDAPLDEQKQRLELVREEVVYLEEQAAEDSFVLLLPAIPGEIGDLEGVARISQLLREDGVAQHQTSG